MSGSCQLIVESIATGAPPSVKVRRVVVPPTKIGASGVEVTTTGRNSRETSVAADDVGVNLVATENFTLEVKPLPVSSLAFENRRARARAWTISDIGGAPWGRSLSRVK